MRATRGTLVAIRDLLAPLDTEDRRARYLAGDFPRPETVKDLDVRYRWDLCWEAELHRVLDLYGRGLNDRHVETALRAVVRPLDGE